jgi:hypothetical protein
MMSDEFDSIAAEAAADEAVQQAQVDAIENPPPLIDPAESWAQIPKMLGGLLSIALPELKNVYTDGACLEWGSAMAQVAEKYEWDASETMARWAPELALTMSTIPLLLPTIAAVKARKEEGKKLPEKTIEPEPDKPGMPEPGGFSEPS